MSTADPVVQRQELPHFGRMLAYPKGDHWSGDTAERAHLQQAGRAAREALSPVEQLEMKLHPWVGFTISPYLAGLAYTPAMLDAAKIGILAASVVSATADLLMLAWLSFRAV